MILFVFWLALFNWSAQVEYVWVFHSIRWIVFQDLSCYIFFTLSNRFLFRLTLISWNWLTYGTLNFLNINLLKINSAHPSKAKCVLRPPLTEHVPLHSKSLCKKYCTCIRRANNICPLILFAHLYQWANNISPLSWESNGKNPNFEKPHQCFLLIKLMCLIKRRVQS